MRSIMTFLPSLWILACLIPAAQAQDIGYVSRKAYAGAIGYVGDDKEYLYFNTDIYRNQRIVCGEKAETTLRFDDRTKLQVGPNSDIVLDEFVYNDDSDVGTIAVSLGNGMMRFITGKIESKENITLATPNVLVGIRGTDVIVAHIDGVTQVSVLEGEVEVTPRNGGDGATATANQTVTVSAPTAAATVSIGTPNASAQGMADNRY